MQPTLHCAFVAFVARAVTETGAAPTGAGNEATAKEATARNAEGVATCMIRFCC